MVIQNDQNIGQRLNKSVLFHLNIVHGRSQTQNKTEVPINLSKLMLATRFFQISQSLDVARSSWVVYPGPYPELSCSGAIAALSSSKWFWY